MTTTLGFIGTGNMGGAMASGLARLKDLKILGYDPDSRKPADLEKNCGLIPVDDPLALAAESDYIIYAVKPGLMEQVVSKTLQELSHSKCLVSIAAGIPVSSMVSWSRDRCPVVRIMPNTPALVGRGVFALCLEHEKISSLQKEFLIRTVSALGRTFVLPENMFDLFTALIGSGPAYVYYFMESMVEAGVLLGLDREKSAEMIKELFAGSSEMSLQQDMPIARLREMVASPGGTTMAGLRALDQKAVRASIMEAVEKAMLRSVELGR